MEYSTKIKVLLSVLSFGVNVLIVAIWVYFYEYHSNLLSPDTHVLMAWLLTSTAIGMAALSVQLYGFLLQGNPPTSWFHLYELRT